jgi:zinc transport system ATP-binding protein
MAGNSDDGKPVVQHRGNALEVTNLSVRLGARDVLRDLSFSVPKGTSFAVIGPNGSGKTVLFRALIGAIPFEGTVHWAPEVHLGYVPQKLDLERDLPITGFDFLRARAAVDRRPHAAIDDVLSLVGLSGTASEQSIGSMSGGQFQRLLVAFALVGDPNVLLLDEPTAGVDEPGQERLNELIHRLQQERGLTTLLISHELTVVDRYATSVLCLAHDRAWIGPPRDVLTEDLLRDMYGAPVRFHLHDR